MIVLEGDLEQTELTMDKTGARIIQHTHERLLRNQDKMSSK